MKALESCSPKHDHSLESPPLVENKQDKRELFLKLQTNCMLLIYFTLLAMMRNEILSLVLFM